MKTVLPCMDIKKLAIMRLSAVGDVVMCLPALVTLQQAFPHCQITWITSPLAYELLAGLPGVDFIVIEKPRSVRDYWRLRKRFRAELFDVLLAMQANTRVNLLYPLIKASCKIGFDRIRAREGQHWVTNHQIPFAKQHLVDSFLSFTQCLGVDKPVIDWPLSIPDAAYAVCQDWDGRVLVIHPVASKWERTWFVERYAEVAIHAARQWQCQIVITGGHSIREQQLCHELTTRLQNAQLTVSNFCGQLSLKQLAAVLQRADCLLAPDTGPVHVANALGTPVLGLYAVAPQALSGPYQGGEFCIDVYEEAVRKLLQRDPKSIAWGVRVHDRQAMRLITVPAVIEQLDALMRQM